MPFIFNLAEPLFLNWTVCTMYLRYLYTQTHACDQSYPIYLPHPLTPLAFAEDIPISYCNSRMRVRNGSILHTRRLFWQAKCRRRRSVVCVRRDGARRMATTGIRSLIVSLTGDCCASCVFICFSLRPRRLAHVTSYVCSLRNCENEMLVY